MGGGGADTKQVHLESIVNRCFSRMSSMLHQSPYGLYKELILSSILLNVCKVRDGDFLNYLCGTVDLGYYRSSTRSFQKMNISGQNVGRLNMFRPYSYSLSFVTHRIFWVKSTLKEKKTNHKTVARFGLVLVRFFY